MSFISAYKLMEEGLEYKHTKRLIQAYCIKISIPSLISAYNQLILLLLLLLLFTFIITYILVRHSIYPVLLFLHSRLVQSLKY